MFLFCLGWLILTVGCLLIFSIMVRNARLYEPEVRSINPRKRLKQISVSSAWHREQLDALATETCEVLDVDPNLDTIDRDFCDSFVYLGGRHSNVDYLISKISDQPYR